MKKETKKLKKTKKFKLKHILIILLIVVAIFACNIIRKFCIALTLSNKAKNYSTSTNFKKVVESGGLDTVGQEITEYVLDDKIKVIITEENSNDITLLFSNKEEDGTYTTKIFFLTSEGENKSVTIENTKEKKLIVQANGLFEIDNNFQLLTSMIFARVTRNSDKNYYIRSNSKLAFPLSDGGNVVDKDTGLVIQNNNSKTFIKGMSTSWTKTRYEFDSVTENDLLEPDINDFAEVIDNRNK